MKFSPRDQIKRYCFFGYVVVFILFLGGVLWAAVTSVDGAVVAKATVVVKGKVKKVQHLEGGVVEKILVKEGQHVTAGQQLLQLEASSLKTGLTIMTSRNNELMAKKARLEAEHNNLDKIIFPTKLLLSAKVEKTAMLLTGQRQLFIARRSYLLGKLAQYDNQITQLQQVAKGLVAQKNARESQKNLLTKEIRSLERLRRKDLIRLPRLRRLQNNIISANGDIGKLEAAIARTQVSISEINIRKLQIRQQQQASILSELREVSAQIEETAEKKLALQRRISKASVRAPKTGVIHQLYIHTIGAVVAPGELLMKVVPAKERLELEVAIKPEDIARVKIGRRSVLRFNLFEKVTTPDLSGRVTHISADLKHDAKQQRPFYTARISLPDDEMARLGQNTIKPGMPADVFIQTGERSVMAYLLAPLSDQLTRAFKER